MFRRRFIMQIVWEDVTLNLISEWKLVCKDMCPFTSINLSKGKEKFAVSKATIEKAANEAVMICEFCRMRGWYDKKFY